MQSRAAFFMQAFLTAIMFYHWVAGCWFNLLLSVSVAAYYSSFSPTGTLSLYSYRIVEVLWARVLCGLSRILRIKIHPIRDILDCPTLTQLRKICVSGIIYSFVVVCVVGRAAGLLVLGSKSMMPFRWKNRCVFWKHFLINMFCSNMGHAQASHASCINASWLTMIVACDLSGPEKRDPLATSLRTWPLSSFRVSALQRGQLILLLAILFISFMPSSCLPLSL